MKLGQEFSCFDFLVMLKKILKKDISNRKVFLVGGSSLYAEVLEKGLPEELPARENFNPNVKKKLLQDFAENGLGKLLEELKEKDFSYYQEVDRRNPRRILRALEVIRNGEKFSSFRKKTIKPDLDIFRINLLLPRSELNERVDTSVEKMFKKGWLEEAGKIKNRLKNKSLGDEHYHHIIATIKAIGYQLIFEYLSENNLTKNISKLNELKLKIKQKTKKYVKQQITWIKKSSKENGKNYFFLPLNKDESIIKRYQNDEWLLELFREKPKSFFSDLDELKEEINHFFEKGTP